MPDADAEYFRCVIDNLSGGFLSVDLDGRVVYGNPTAGRILHIPMGAIAGRGYRQALEAYPALCAVIGAALESRRIVHRAEIAVRHGDTEMVIGYSTFLVRASNNRDMGVGITFQDLTLHLRPKPQDRT